MEVKTKFRRAMSSNVGNPFGHGSVRLLPGTAWRWARLSRSRAIGTHDTPASESATVSCGCRTSVSREHPIDQRFDTAEREERVLTQGWDPLHTLWTVPDDPT